MPSALAMLCWISALSWDSCLLDAEALELESVDPYRRIRLLNVGATVGTDAATMMTFCSTVAAAKYGMTSSLPGLADVWRNALPRGCLHVKSQLLRAKTVRNSIVRYMAAIMALLEVSF